MRAAAEERDTVMRAAAVIQSDWKEGSRNRRAGWQQKGSLSLCADVASIYCHITWDGWRRGGWTPTRIGIQRELMVRGGFGSVDCIYGTTELLVQSYVVPVAVALLDSSASCAGQLDCRGEVGEARRRGRLTVEALDGRGRVACAVSRAVASRRARAAAGGPSRR